MTDKGLRVAAYLEHIALAIRLYSAGQTGGARADRLLFQAKLALDPDLRLKVVRKMYALRFGEEEPDGANRGGSEQQWSKHRSCTI